jgi:hypothetical protein
VSRRLRRPLAEDTAPLPPLPPPTEDEERAVGQAMIEWERWWREHPDDE